MPETLRTSPLDPLHQGRNARMAPFAGWSLPMQFAGIVAEHLQTRSKASLFDVSHMGQMAISGPGAPGDLGGILPVDFSKLKPGRNKYSFACNEEGGIIDDLIVGNDGEAFFLVCNASREAAVKEHLDARCGPGTRVERIEEQALLAVQGPSAGDVVGGLFAEASGLFFMDSVRAEFSGAPCRLTRCGYTGEDGFEISIAACAAPVLAAALLEHRDCEPAGLGARDTLRLEACLCLYGAELSEQVTPVEAGLVWAIPPSLRSGGGYLGGRRIGEQIEQGAERMLVALAPEGRAPVRAGAKLFSGGDEAGVVTSGGYSPTLKRPIALALVGRDRADAGTELSASVRDSLIDCRVASMPFVPHNYRIRPRRTPAGGGKQ